MGSYKNQQTFQCVSPKIDSLRTKGPSLPKLTMLPPTLTPYAKQEAPSPPMVLRNLALHLPSIPPGSFVPSLPSHPIILPQLPVVAGGSTGLSSVTTAPPVLTPWSHTLQPPAIMPQSYHRVQPYDILPLFEPLETLDYSHSPDERERNFDSDFALTPQSFEDGGKDDDPYLSGTDNIDEPGTDLAATAGPIKKKRGRKPIPGGSERRKQQNRVAQKAFRERKDKHLQTIYERVSRYEVFKEDVLAVISSLVAENNALRQVRDQNAVSVTDYLTQFGLENLLESTTDHEARDLRHRSRSTLNQLSTARDRSRSGNSADSPMSAGARSLHQTPPGRASVESPSMPIRVPFSVPSDTSLSPLLQSSTSPLLQSCDSPSLVEAIKDSSASKAHHIQRQPKPLIPYTMPAPPYYTGPTFPSSFLPAKQKGVEVQLLPSPNHHYTKHQSN